MAGLELTGFVAETFETIREQMNSDLRSRFGQSIDLSDSSVLGQLVAVMAERYATLWELAEAVNSSQNPDAATGAQLDALCALTGTNRNPATSSTVLLTLMGDVGVLIPAGSQASMSNFDAVWATDEDATTVAATSWASSTAYTVGQVRTKSGGPDPDYFYVVTQAGTSAGSGGPTGETSGITDGTVIWDFIGRGAGGGIAQVTATCTETGPTVGNIGDIDTIETPVSSWDAVYNTESATPGQNEETDSELRVRRELELSQAGSSPADAIRAAILEVADVTSCVVFVNDTDVTDGDGVPPHSVEILVQGGDDAEIFQAVFDSVAAGVGTYGTESGTVTDSSGNDHTVKFSRPDPVLIYVDVTLIKDPETYPSDGDTQVKDAIVAYGLAQAVGRDVVASAIVAQGFKVAGVLDVNDIDIGTTASPTLGTTITISNREIAVYDTSRITVTTSDGTP